MRPPITENVSDKRTAITLYPPSPERAGGSMEYYGISASINARNSEMRYMINSLGDVDKDKVVSLDD